MFYVLIIILVVVVGVTVSVLLRPMVSGAPYVATGRKGVESIFELADIHVGETVVDLGSGDGELLLEAGKYGARAIGYEIDKKLVRITRRRIAENNLNMITVREESFWKADLLEADVVLVFLAPHALFRLEKKLRKELRSGARVVSFAFEFRNWEKRGEQGNAYLYIK